MVVKEGRVADGDVGRVYTILGNFAYVRAVRAEGGVVADHIRDQPPPQPLL